MGKSDLGPVHASVPLLEWGNLCTIKPGAGRLGWIATGSMVKTSLSVAQLWTGSAVWSAPSLKPLDAEQVCAVCRQHQAVVVLEEHSICGGLGSAVAEIAAANCPTWVCRIGIRDRFSRFCGSYAYLMKEHQLDAEAVRCQVTDFLARLSGHLSQPARAKTRGIAAA